MRKEITICKLVALAVFALCISSQINAQATLWGTSSQGGDSGLGVIFGVPTGGTNETTTYSLKGIPGWHPYFTTPVMSSYGVIFGVTQGGGLYDGGVLFAYDTTTGNFTDAHDFSPASGKTPDGSLLLASDNKFYGVTSSGGANNAGVIFCYDPFASKYTDLYDFTSTTGSGSECTLIQTASGKMYGMTFFGGANGGGVIFSFNPKTLAYKDLYDFKYATGMGPFGGALLTCPNGKLYGMTYEGGANSDGVIFSFDTTTSVYKDIHDFDGTSGSDPTGTLVAYPDGKLYSMTSKGGAFGFGTFFAFDTISNTLSTIASFNGTSSGSSGSTSMYMSANKTLYGMTSYGGANGAGKLFSYNNKAGYKSVYDFKSGSGASPNGALMETTMGTFYGLTYNGGKGGDGVLFKVDTLGNYKDLIDFAYGANGTYPSGSLVYMGGQLYGLTYAGGKNNGGVLFSFDPLAKTYAKLIDLDTIKGLNPGGSLIEGSNGYLWGFSTYGGAHKSGTLFEFDPVGKGFTVMHSFNDTLDGSPQYCNLVNIASMYYGTTETGGDSASGVIYSYDYLSATYKDMYSFKYTTGYNPYGTIINVKNKLYGMTSSGGTQNYGVIYSFDTAGTTYTVLHNFDNTGGSSPQGNLVFASNKKFYGLTMSGGANGNGVLFNMDTNGTIYTDLHDFTNTEGSGPYGSLMQASNTKLYGLTYGGASFGGGSLFESDLVGAFVKKFDFIGPNGLNPYGSLIETNLTGIDNITGNSNNVVAYPNPSNGRFIIEVERRELRINSTVAVYNMLGEKVLLLPFSVSKPRLSVDLSSQPAGLYLYRVLSEEGSLIGEGKLTIQK
jgi:uncharacterized repeat protein (TIGR03803 family)